LCYRTQLCVNPFVQEKNLFYTQEENMKRMGEFFNPKGKFPTLCVDDDNEAHDKRGDKREKKKFQKSCYTSALIGKHFWFSRLWVPVSVDRKGFLKNGSHKTYHPRITSS